MNNNVVQLTVLLVFSLVALISCANTNDFDLVCGYFDLLQKENVSKEMTSENKFTFINDLVSENLINDSAARVSLNAIVGYVPVEGRYALYKDAAEETLNKSWQCGSMKALLQDL